MKITDAKVIVTCPGRNYVLYKIFTDSGLYGVGDATLNGRELGVAELLDKHITPLLIGKNPDSIEDIWQMLYRGAYWRGGPVLNTALSGVDMALWDIKGKACNKPVYSLLGGKTRSGAFCYTHCAGRDFSELDDTITKFIEMGFKFIRAQISLPGHSSTYGQGGQEEAALAKWGDSDLPMIETWEPNIYLLEVPRLFEHLRDKFGHEIELLHDVHERLIPIQAARLAKTLEPYHLFFLEDAIRPEHKESFRLIRNFSTTPLAMGELFSSLWECVPLFIEQLIDFIRCDLTHVGGITAAKKIANLAEPFGIQTAWHGPGDASPIGHAANVHVDVSIPNFGVQEMVFFSDQVKEVIPGGPFLKDGALHVSEDPGLGTDVNEELVKKYPYQRAYLPIVRRLDGSILDW